MSDESSAALIREVAAEVLSNVADTDVVDVGLQNLWPTIVHLGWPLVGIPESRGGGGGTVADLCALVASVGQHGAAIPLLEQALGSWILMEAGQKAPTDLVTVAASCDGVLDLVTSSSGATATGVLHSVPWAAHADRIIATAESGSQRFLVVLENDARVHRRDETNVAGEPRSIVEVTELPVEPMPGPPDPDEVELRGALLSTWAIVGAMDAALDMTRRHVGTREQFGRPLARFQAVSNALAAMSSEVSVARSAVEGALAGVSGVASPSELDLALARVAVLDVTTAVADHAHQLHGAMGITREYPLHRVTRRVWAWRDEWGSERSWRQRLGRAAARLGPERLWDEATRFASNAH